jgi:hypothetical protein
MASGGGPHGAHVQQPGADHFPLEYLFHEVILWLPWEEPWPCGRRRPLAGSSRSHWFTAVTGPWRGAVIEPEIVVEQHRHPVRDRRPVPDIPRLPAARREKGHQHEQRT